MRSRALAQLPRAPIVSLCASSAISSFFFPFLTSFHAGLTACLCWFIVEVDGRPIVPPSHHSLFEFFLLSWKLAISEIKPLFILDHASCSPLIVSFSRCSVLVAVQGVLRIPFIFSCSSFPPPTSIVLDPSQSFEVDIPSFY